MKWIHEPSHELPLPWRDVSAPLAAGAGHGRVVLGFGDFGGFGFSWDGESGSRDVSALPSDSRLDTLVTGSTFFQTKRAGMAIAS